jgi:hypothetical protein
VSREYCNRQRLSFQGISKKTGEKSAGYRPVVIIPDDFHARWVLAAGVLTFVHAMIEKFYCQDENVSFVNESRDGDGF